MADEGRITTELIVLSLVKFIYQKCAKPILFLFSPESMHSLFVWLGENIASWRLVNWPLSLIYGHQEKAPLLTVDGITYRGPVSLAAGFDYNGKLSDVLFYMGFAGEEVGSVTARSCEGNVPPRLTRLIKSRSILVYKGLRNDGVDQVIKRLKKKKIHPDYVLGISIAKTNDYLSVEEEDGISDYCYSLRRLVEEKMGDFYTINVSCPNVHGGEDFASPERLEHLLSALKEIDHQRPMYVKLPINKSWDEFKELLQVVKKYHFNGVVIGNLNKNYDDVPVPEERPLKYRGGLSGAPCKNLSNELIKKTRELYPENFTIIGLGGILSPEDAIEKIKLGANLVQLITGMIFNGPHLMKEINLAYREYCKNE